MINNKKVFVSGCFDMLHSGHVAFLNEASKYGDLYVGIGSDSTVRSLKGRETINSEDERRYMIGALKCVTECRVNRGGGMLDFVEELDDIKPNYFVVNEDGNSSDKEALCKEMGIEYLVLKRIPHEGLPVRSTTAIRNFCTIPYRIDLAGGWLDQPYVSKHYPGWVITCSIEPTIEFNERSGMATSSRKRAVALWNHKLPLDKPIKNAEILFSVENQPGKVDVAGSQDSLGITMPGVNRYFYEDEKYWPTKIESSLNPDVIEWLEQHIYMITLWPREDGYHPLADADIKPEKVQKLAQAAERCWMAIMDKNLVAFGKAVTDSFNAQIAMFPHTSNAKIQAVIHHYADKCTGWKLSGAGGGGYLILIADKPIEGAFQIKIRRGEDF